jgi:DNA-binding response OmpR family regulator
MRILVVEDDRQLAEMLTEALSGHYAVDTVHDGLTAQDWVNAYTYDLILLDVTLPKLDGIRFCQQLRQSQCALPVLMLTARDTIADKITGLDAGADDYVVKPFNLQELLARVRALLRRGGMAQPGGLSWGQLTLHASTHDVDYNHQAIQLTPKEFALLELLISSGRRVLSRTGIIDCVWAAEYAPTEETVKSHIKSLRQKLRLAGAPEDFIETVHGLGYRLQQQE